MLIGNQKKNNSAENTTEEFSNNDKNNFIQSVTRENKYAKFYISGGIGVVLIIFGAMSYINNYKVSESAETTEDIANNDIETTSRVVPIPSQQELIQLRSDYSDDKSNKFSSDKFNNKKTDENNKNALSRAERKRLIELEKKEKLRRWQASPLAYSARSNQSSRTTPVNKRETPFDKQIADLERMSSQMSTGGQFNYGQPVSSQDENLDYANKVYSQTTATVKVSPPKDMSYMLMEGKIISAILETGIDSSLPGKTRAIVDRNVYSASGKNILIPKGSTLLGEYNTQVSRGQKRVYSIWPRIIRPDGVNIALDSPATDNLGRSGLAGDVDTHFFSRFGSSVLLSIIGAGSSNNYSNPLRVTPNDLLRGSLYQSFSATATKSLEESINIKDTINLDQGESIKIFVSKDIDFSAAYRDR